jgi:hypothetical protein
MPQQDETQGGYGFIPYGKGRKDPSQSNAYDAIQAVNQGMLNGQPADLTLADYLGALEQRAGQPYANKVALELQNVAPQLSRDILSAKATEGLRKEFRARVELARNGQLPPDLLPGGGQQEAPQQQPQQGQAPSPVATMQPQGGAQQTPASQQLNSNTPGEARGAAADVGQRSPQSMAAQAPGSGVTPPDYGGQTQGSLPPTPAIATYQQGLQTQQAEGRAKVAQAGVQQTQAGNQSQILQAVQMLQQNGLPVPGEWRALSEGREVGAEPTSTQLSENQKNRDAELAQANARASNAKTDPLVRQFLMENYKQGQKDISGADATLDKLGQMDRILEQAETALTGGEVSTGAIAGGKIGKFVQKFTNEAGVNVLEQAFGTEWSQAVDQLRGLGAMSDRDSAAIARTTGEFDKDDKFNLQDIKRRRALMKDVLGRMKRQRDVAVQNRDAVIREAGFEGTIQGSAGRDDAPSGEPTAPPGKPTPEEAAAELARRRASNAR